jgi:hypothetical protein
MIRSAKILEQMNLFFNRFEHIWFKSDFDLENYGFWKCTYNKNYSCLCDREAWMHNIHNIRSIFSQNIFISKM